VLTWLQSHVIAKEVLLFSVGLRLYIHIFRYFCCMATSTIKKSIFTLEEDNRRKLKAVAGILDKDQQDIVNEALKDWIAKWEKKNGKIPVK
jgi:hypothetical protein